MPHHPRSSHLFSNTPKKGANVSPLSCHTSLPLVASLSCFLNSSNCLRRQEKSKPLGARGPNVWNVRGLTWFKKSQGFIGICLDMLAVRWGLFTKELRKKKREFVCFPSWNSTHLDIISPDYYLFTFPTKMDRWHPTWCQPRRKSTTKTLKFQRCFSEKHENRFIFSIPKKMVLWGKKSEHVVALIPRSTFTNLEQTNWVQKTMEKSGHPTPPTVTYSPQK